MESVDRLRDEIRDRIIHPHEWLVMIDAIEAEVAEGYAPLPVGSDGKPIRPGDTVCGEDGHGWHVTHLRIGDSYSVAATDGSRSRELRPGWLTHEKPPTVEDVLLECCKEYHGLLIEGMSDIPHDMPAPSEVIDKYAARLRLAEGGDAS